MNFQLIKKQILTTTCRSTLFRNVEKINHPIFPLIFTPSPTASQSHKPRNKVNISAVMLNRSSRIRHKSRNILGQLIFPAFLILICLNQTGCKTFINEEKVMILEPRDNVLTPYILDIAHSESPFLTE